MVAQSGHLWSIFLTSGAYPATQQNPWAGGGGGTEFFRKDGHSVPGEPNATGLGQDPCTGVLKAPLYGILMDA